MDRFTGTLYNHPYICMCTSAFQFTIWISSSIYSTWIDLNLFVFQKKSAVRFNRDVFVSLHITAIYVAFSLTPLHAWKCSRRHATAEDGLRNLALLDYSSVQTFTRSSTVCKRRRAIEPCHFGKD